MTPATPQDPHEIWRAANRRHLLCAVDEVRARLDLFAQGHRNREPKEQLAALRAEEAKLLEGCEHAYEDGRHAVAGAQVKICAICGRLLRARDEKLWG